MYPYNISPQINYQLNKKKASQTPPAIPSPTPMPETRPAPVPIPPPVPTPMPEEVAQPTMPTQPVMNKYILEMVKEAIMDEQKDADYYNRLGDRIECAEDKDIIRKIHLDEIKHQKMLKSMYYQLTGDKATDKAFEETAMKKHLADNFSMSMLSELNSVEFYRKLYVAFLNVEIRDWIYEIITDEQAHAQKLNYLYSKYKDMED